VLWVVVRVSLVRYVRAELVCAELVVPLDEESPEYAW
jgi:hypothetical protein